MRKQKSTVTLLALALVLAFGAVPVMAAEDTVPPTIPTVYPIEVHSSESGGVYRLEKVYCLAQRTIPLLFPHRALNARDGTMSSLTCSKRTRRRRTRRSTSRSLRWRAAPRT